MVIVMPKYSVECGGCGAPLVVSVNKELPKHEKPVAFCSRKCFKKWRSITRRGGRFEDQERF